jgi:hypothetical protein
MVIIYISRFSYKNLKVSVNFSIYKLKIRHQGNLHEVRTFQSESNISMDSPRQSLNCKGSKVSESCISRFQNSDYEDYYRLECNTLQFNESRPTFWRTILPPKDKQEARMKLVELICCLAYILTLKVEAMCSSEMSVDSSDYTRQNSTPE